MDGRVSVLRVKRVKCIKFLSYINMNVFVQLASLDGQMHTHVLLTLSIRVTQNDVIKDPSMLHTSLCK